MKIKSRGAQAFNVPNTEEGHVFLQLLRKFRNRGWYYRARGRGSRKLGGDKSYLPQEYAKWLAVYMSPKNDPQAYIPNVAPQVREAHPMFVADQGIHNLRVAEWSAPIDMGNSIGVTNGGLAYNSDVHGESMNGYGQSIGVAINNHDGSIGDGEARVQTHILFNPPPVRMDNDNVRLSNFAAEWDAMRARTEAHPEPAPPIPGWDDPNPEAVELPVPQVDDTVELTQEESDLLEKILKNSRWRYQSKEAFNTLFNKLVD